MPDFADLFRRRDDTAPDLIAIDGTDRFLIDEAPHVHGDALRQPGEVAVVDDRLGVLTLGLITQYGASDIRVVQDSLVGERALEANAGTFGLRGFHHPDSLEDAFRDVRLVVLRLSKSHDRLDEIARTVARFAAPDVVLLCGGNVKYMNLSQNDVLRRSFGEVTASRGRGSRACSSRRTRCVPRRTVWPRPIPGPDRCTSTTSA
ncbi:hypothetical protein QP157_01320 [Sphingomonas sp. LR61]|uniref:hypothetical protein n=1 Tax=Sphingomonas sp. LR61 TaxID=3050234 RepID=UPI002FE37B16